MKSPNWLLSLSVLLLILMSWAMVSYRVSEPVEATHPRFDSMETGGQFAKDDLEHWWLGAAIGLVTIAMCTACLSLADGQSRDDHLLTVLNLSVGAAVAGAYWMMMLAYADYSVQEVPRLSGPFPSPTAWLVFGVWIAPIGFTAIYFFGFDRWFATSAKVSHAHVVPAEKATS